MVGCRLLSKWNFSDPLQHTSDHYNLCNGKQFQVELEPSGEMREVDWYDLDHVRRAMRWRKDCRVVVACISDMKLKFDEHGIT